MSDLDVALKQLSERVPAYRRYRDYYDGDHQLCYATEKWKNAFGSLFRKFADNLCPAVIDAVADRLELTGFSAEQGKSNAGDIAQQIWQRNRMDRDAGEAHIEALRAGDSYVIVWPNPEGEATIYPQQATLMTVMYDEERPGRMLWAAKGWIVRSGEHAGKARVTLYYADRLEKYVTRSKVSSGGTLKASSFVELPEEPLVLNQWNVVPVFHFANNAPLGSFGTSELKPVIPVQDALNKSVLDMLVAMEFAAYRQRWATGLDVETDETTGKPKKPFEPGADRLWAVASDEVEFGEFGAADLTKFVGVSDSFRMEVARVSGTPVHYLMLQGGAVPSGEALKTLEVRLIKKCRDRQTSFGNVWEDAMRLALMIEGPSAEAAGELSTQWKDPAPRSEKEHAETIETKQRIGISRRQALRELDYSDIRIAEMDTERSVEGADMGTALLAAFERGGTAEVGAR